MISFLTQISRRYGPFRNFSNWRQQETPQTLHTVQVGSSFGAAWIIPRKSFESFLGKNALRKGIYSSYVAASFFSFSISYLIFSSSLAAPQQKQIKCPFKENPYNFLGENWPQSPKISGSKFFEGLFLRWVLRNFTARTCYVICIVRLPTRTVWLFMIRLNENHGKNERNQRIALK